MIPARTHGTLRLKFSRHDMPSVARAENSEGAFAPSLYNTTENNWLTKR
jgi:hypothetical protein